MDHSVDELAPRLLYKLLSGTITPRPIAWVSTRDADGRLNLAPYSFFNAVSASPPTLMFAGGTHAPGRRKDSVAVALETGEFVVNLVSEELAEAMNRSSVAAPRGFDEFAYAGVTPAPSRRVRAPRVAQSPVSFECSVAHVYEVEPGGSTAVFGRVRHLHLRDDLVDADGNVDILRLRPLGRLAGGAYTRLGEVLHLTRPRWEDPDA